MYATACTMVSLPQSCANVGVVYSYTSYIIQYTRGREYIHRLQLDVARSTLLTSTVYRGTQRLHVIVLNDPVQHVSDARRPTPSPTVGGDQIVSFRCSNVNISRRNSHLAKKGYSKYSSKGVPRQQSRRVSTPDGSAYCTPTGGQLYS